MSKTEPETQPVEQLVDQALAAYSPTDAAIAEMNERYSLLEVHEVGDSEGLARVHEARMDYRCKRVGVEKTRVALKGDALRFGRTVDAEAKRLTALLRPGEHRLKSMEDAVEAGKAHIREEAERVERERSQLRIDAFRELGSDVLEIAIIGWDEDTYHRQLGHAREQHQARVEHEEREAAERKAVEESAAKALEVKVAAEREARRKADLEADQQRKAEEARLRAERVEIEAQRLELGRERALAEEKAAEQRKAEEEQRRIEREKLDAERERLDQERRAVEAQRAAGEAAQVERERARTEEKARAEHAAELARLAPQNEKIRELAAAVDSLMVPEVDCKDKLSRILEVTSERILAEAVA